MSISSSNIQRKEHHNGGRGPFPNWIDCNTVKNTQCVISNIFLERNRASFQHMGLTNQYIGVANFPLRAWNCVNAFQNRNYWKIALDVLAFSCLFFPPYGPKASIVIDLASESINIYRKIYDSNNSDNEQLDCLDCTIRENALKVLGLSEEDVKNRSILDNRYQSLCKEWDTRIEKAQHSPQLLKKFKTLRIQVETAYETIKK